MPSTATTGAAMSGSIQRRCSMPLKISGLVDAPLSRRARVTHQRRPVVLLNAEE
ncbi:hypothetical protein ACFPRL_18865 [Pseudoclavibacter helvolus]